MKQIPLLQGKALLIELPEGAISPRVYNKFLEFDIRYSGSDGNETEGILLPPGNWQIIGMLSEVTEEQAAELVERFGDITWLDYITKLDCHSALESLESAIRAEGWYFENTYGDRPNYANYNYGNAYPHPSERKRFERDLSEWGQAQSRVLDRSRCLLLGRDS